MSRFATYWGQKAPNQEELNKKHSYIYQDSPKCNDILLIQGPENAVVFDGTTWRLLNLQKLEEDQ